MQKVVWGCGVAKTLEGGEDSWGPDPVGLVWSMDFTVQVTGLQPEVGERSVSLQGKVALSLLAGVTSLEVTPPLCSYVLCKTNRTLLGRVERTTRDKGVKIAWDTKTPQPQSHCGLCCH